jgi:hypothetical protein
VGCVNVKDGERDFAEKGLSNEPEQACRVFSDRPEYRDVSELAVCLSNDKNTLIFQLIQLADFGFHIDSLQIIHIRILIRQGNYVTAIIGKNQLANNEFGGNPAIFSSFRLRY